MKLRLSMCIALSAGLLVACGSSDESGSGGEGGEHSHGDGGAAASTTSTTSTTTGGGGGGGDGGAGGSEPTALLAPVMKTIMPMSGALHVTWTNMTDDCDAVLLFRNQDEGEYALEYTLSGAANQKHDDEATTASSEYCYKAQCQRGDLVSDDSNEICGSP